MPHSRRLRSNAGSVVMRAAHAVRVHAQGITQSRMRHLMPLYASGLKDLYPC